MKPRATALTRGLLALAAGLGILALLIMWGDGGLWRSGWAAGPIKLWAPLIAGAQKPRVWAASSLERIGRTDQPGAVSAAAISAARGEYESFQIIVQAPAGGLSGVSLAVSELSGPGGARIGAEHITLYRAHYVEVRRPSYDPGGANRPLGAGWYADALIPFTDPTTGRPSAGGAIPAVPVAVAAGHNQPFWIDVFVPRDAPAGSYSARYNLTSEQGSFQGSVSLTVWDFTLPLRPALTSSFVMHEPSMVLREELLRHRLMPLSTPAAEQRGAIERWGLGATSLDLWSGAQQGACAAEPPPPVEAIRALAATAQPGLMLYTYSADEIDDCTNLYGAIKEWARALHAAGVHNLIPMRPTRELFDDGSGSGRSAVDIWVVLPTMYNAAPDLVAEAQAKGDQVWSYNALVQDNYSPKWQIDFAPINYRIQPGFISQSLGLTGLLYWSVDRWTADPWSDVDTYINSDGLHFPGEGMLVYPGGQIGIGGIAPSMRLKWLRDGVEDYEYVALLRNQGRGETALAITRTVGADWRNWTRDHAALEAARLRLATLLTDGNVGR